MALTRCPGCGYTERDGRPHDGQVYLELCTDCDRRSRRRTELEEMIGNEREAGRAYSGLAEAARRELIVLTGKGA